MASTASWKPRTFKDKGFLYLWNTPDTLGWIGDNPFIFLDCARIRALGWQPKLTIREAIVRTLEYLQANRWVLAEPRGR